MTMSHGNGDPQKNETEEISHWILNKLKSYESVVLHFQRLLVWEKPLHSTLFMVLLHFIFLYVTMRSQHFFGYFSSFLLFFVWLDMWKHKIWPEIRAIQPDALAEWGELNPDLLSLPEMCGKAAEYYIEARSQMKHVLKIKQTFPGKFCIVFCAACVISIAIGRKIPGAVIAYFIVMGAALWPLITINNVPMVVYGKLEPFILQLRHTVQQRPNKILEIATKVVEENQRSAPSVNQDEDISDFIPELDDENVNILTRATVDSNQNSENSSKTNSVYSGRSTPDLTINETYLAALPNQFPNLQEEIENDDFGLPTYLQSTSNSEQAPTTNMQQFLPDIGREAIANAISGAMQDKFTSIMQTIQPQDGSLPSTSTGTPTSDFEILEYDDGDEDNNQVM